MEKNWAQKYICGEKMTNMRSVLTFYFSFWCQMSHLSWCWCAVKLYDTYFSTVEFHIAANNFLGMPPPLLESFWESLRNRSFEKNKVLFFSKSTPEIWLIFFPMTLHFGQKFMNIWQRLSNRKNLFSSKNNSITWLHLAYYLVTTKK